MATINVKDASDATVAIEKPLAPGRAAASASRPVVLSTEDLATLATQTTLAAVLAKIIAAPATEAKQDTIIGHVDGIETLITALNALITTQNGYLDGVESALTGAQPAGENHIGSVTGLTSYIDVTLSLDTNAYASGDLLADTQVLTNAMRVNDGTGILQSIQVLDEDDQGIAFDLVFLSANNTLGTENSAVSVSDANARDILGLVSIATGDFIDLGGCRIATKTGVGLVVKPASGTRNVYVAAISRGTGTYTASGVRLRLGFLQD
jgi:hypothetical protein